VEQVLDFTMDEFRRLRLVGHPEEGDVERREKGIRTDREDITVKAPGFA